MGRLLYLLLGVAFVSIAQGVDVLSEVGRKVSLSCPINAAQCGEVFTLSWHKGNQRIYFLGERQAKPDPKFADRIQVDHSANQSESFLVIKTVEVTDEGIYKCKITYYEVRDNCQAEHHINLTTLIKPEFVRVLRTDVHEKLDNGTVIKNIAEDETISLTCEAGGAKPIPEVQWWNGTSQIKANEEQEVTGFTGTGKATIKFPVSRGDLGVNYECRAYHPALDTYISTYLKLDVDVRPKGLKMIGVDSHVVRGSKVELQCIVQSARPPANVTWYNGTTPLQESSSKLEIQGDGTYDTISKLVFIATRFENEQTLGCEASNEIMVERKEEPMREILTLEVLYPPIVSVTPENIVVNESTDVLMFCHYLANPATLKSVKWLRGEEEVDINANKDHYEGGNVEQTSLFIKNATRKDMGNYTCILENEVGAMSSQNLVYVSIYFKPETSVRMNPASPVIASEDLDVTLFCQVEAGNPSVLTHVRWFLDGVILKELPDCSNTTFCDINPIQLFLEGITRNFHGNYSCMGKNEAGWGPRSPDSELIVYYPPSGAELHHTPDRVVKRGSMTLYCSVKDRGRPENTTYRWTRGNHPVMDVNSANWTIDPVTLEAETNFTCTAVNLGGESKPANLFIKVYAPPTFIVRLPPYFGTVMTSQNIQVTCRVECSPICSIEWEKNGRRLETGPYSKYYVENIVIPPDTRTNDFQSVQSTLIWNMTSWPGGQLDRIADNANYTCISTGNEVGSGVKSTTFFGVEYPPENLTVSNSVVNVIEGNVPEKVLCNAKAYPESSYQWRREGDNEVIIKGNALILNFPILRKNGGNYYCEAYNRHGNNSQKTFINVLFKPECGIIKKEVDGKLSLECSVIANPQDVDFTWKIKNENETIEEHIEKGHLQSILTLETRVENFRTYLCFANNSVGVSIPCEMDVSGSMSWWARLENENLIILLAIILFIILMVIVICVIIIIVCRRKRAADKYPNAANKDNKNTSPNDALLPPESDKAFYENLPFHNMQNPPNKPYRPEFSDLDYADVDYRSYGPINYKAASIFAAQKKQEDEELL